MDDEELVMVGVVGVVKVVGRVEQTESEIDVGVVVLLVEWLGSRKKTGEELARAGSR